MKYENCKEICKQKDDNRPRNRGRAARHIARARLRHRRHAPLGQRFRRAYRRGDARGKAGKPVRLGGQPLCDLGAGSFGDTHNLRRVRARVRRAPLQGGARQVPAGHRKARGLLRRHGAQQQPPFQRIFKLLHIQRGLLYLHRHAVRAARRAGRGGKRSPRFAAGAPFGHQRGDSHGLHELPRDILRRHSKVRAARTGPRLKGIFAAHIHELPSVRRAALGAARHRAGILQHLAQHSAARHSRRAVHPVARTHTDLRARRAHRHLLRRSHRTAR